MDRSEQLIAIAALAGPAAAIDAWTEWRATVPIETASNLLTWAAGYIHRNLLAAGVDDAYLRGIYRHNLLANGARTVAAIEPIRDLSSRWLITPLKSFGMTGDRYSRGLRPLADFDFYVARDDVLAVKAHLESLGFDPLMNVSSDEFGLRILRQRGSWNFKTPAGVDLDLHWRLLEHLSTATSEHLVAANSTIVDSEFGTIRRLDDELMLVCIAVHYQLLGTTLMSGVFDFAHLAKHVDVDRAAQLALATNSVREISQLCEEIRGLVDAGELPHIDRLAAALDSVLPAPAPQTSTRVVRRLFEPLPRRYFEPEYLTRPAAYRFWFALGRRPIVERVLRRLGGPFTRIRPDSSDGPLSNDGALGVGWHYRYPGDRNRWANIPDTRTVFTGTGDVTRVRIELDASAWNAAPVPSFGVFCNGRLLGYCGKSESTFEFAVPRRARASTMELSMRQTARTRFTHPGIHVKWYRMLAPVVRIELLAAEEAHRHA
jgi:hypothetical protein